MFIECRVHMPDWARAYDDPPSKSSSAWYPFRRTRLIEPRPVMKERSAATSLTLLTA